MIHIIIREITFLIYLLVMTEIYDIIALFIIFELSCMGKSFKIKRISSIWPNGQSHIVSDHQYKLRSSPGFSPSMLRRRKKLTGGT